MMLTKSTLRQSVIALVAFLGIIATALLIRAYDKSQTKEIGYPGVGMQITEHENRLEAKLAANVVPAALPPASADGPLAVDAYENVQLLGHLTTGQFTRLMTAITTWVAPEQGCVYCHNANNLASDEVYAKVVARRMLQQTWHLNENWQQHVKGTGVTCYTCHRGNNVPEYLWFDEVPQDRRGDMLGNRAEQNAPALTAGLTSLPGNAFETYLDGETNVRVQSTEIFPNENRSSIKQTEWTYAMMMHFSQGLGVNCTFCHNSRSWSDWSQSPIQRTTAWYGIRMVRNLNQSYLEPIRELLPAHRLGPQGDVPKVNCATCHQGAYKPLLGQSMLGDYPSLAQAVEQPIVYEIDVTEDHVVLPAKVEFDLSSAEVLESSHRLLDAVGRAIAANGPIEKVRVIGHTDVSGDPEGNLALSLRRARAVVAYLEGKVGETVLEAQGAGEAQPLCTTPGPACNQRNRRVEFLIPGIEEEIPEEGAEGDEGEAAAAAPAE